MRVLNVLTAVVFLGVPAQAWSDGPPGAAPKLPLGKETTYVTGPLDAEGYIDYQAALNDALGKGVRPERNACIQLFMALGPAPEGGTGLPEEFFKRLGVAEPPRTGPYLIGLYAYGKDHLKIGEAGLQALLEQQARLGQRPWQEKDFPQVSFWLKANEKPLAVAVAASRLPDYYHPLVAPTTEKGPAGLRGLLLPGVQKSRELGNALTTRAMLRVGAGKFDEAWEDLLACHRLARLLARGGTLIEALVGIAIDQIACNADLAYLERANLNSRQIQDRLKDLQGLPPLPPLADKINLSERLLFLDQLQLIHRNGFGALASLVGGSAPPPNAEEGKALAMIDWEPTLRSGNRWYDRLAAAVRLPDRVSRNQALGKIDADLKALKKEATALANLAKLAPGDGPPDKQAGKAIGDVLITLIMPALRKVQDAYDRAEQVQRNLHIAFALAAYQRDHDRYPARLDELAPDYLAVVPDDLFSGKALIWRPGEKGYLLYSIGVNGKDEGGRWFEDNPPGDDPRVRMPLAEVALATTAETKRPSPVPARKPAPPAPTSVPATDPAKETTSTSWLMPIVAIGLGIILLIGAALMILRARHPGQGPGPTSGVSCACPACGKNLKAKPALAGKKVKCPECGKVLLVPQP